jgi:hypothetical protein
MSEILTLDQEANGRCMQEINGVLKKYGRALNPKVVITMAGLQLSVEVIAAQLAGPAGPGPSPTGNLGGAKNA